MKELFKLGYLTNIYNYIDENGQLVGTTAHLFKQAFNFAIDKFNVSYQELDPKLARCLGNDCSYPIRMLEEKVYYIARLPNLPQLFPNITSGPSFFHIQCFISTAPDIQEEYQNHNVTHIFNKFDHYSIGLFFLVTSMLICLFKSYNIVSSVWESLKIFHLAAIGNFFLHS